MREVIEENETDAITFQSISGSAINNLAVTTVAFHPGNVDDRLHRGHAHYWDSNYDGMVEHDYGAVAGVCTLHVEDHFAAARCQRWSLRG